MAPVRKFLRESPGTEAAAPSEWAPFGGASDFGKNMGIAFAALFVAFALAFATGALIRRRFLCFRRRNPAVEKPDASKATAMPPDVIPSIVFSAKNGLPIRSGGASTEASAECTICLLEFADGDSVRLLPNCGHGFHAGCIDLWIASRRSCPTCRKSSLPSPERLEAGGF